MKRITPVLIRAGSCLLGTLFTLNAWAEHRHRLVPVPTPSATPMILPTPSFAEIALRFVADISALGLLAFGLYLLFILAVVYLKRTHRRLRALELTTDIHASELYQNTKKWKVFEERWGGRMKQLEDSLVTLSAEITKLKKSPALQTRRALDVISRQVTGAAPASRDEI